MSTRGFQELLVGQKILQTNASLSRRSPMEGLLELIQAKERGFFAGVKRKAMRKGLDVADELTHGFGERRPDLNERWP